MKACAALLVVALAGVLAPGTGGSRLYDPDARSGKYLTWDEAVAQNHPLVAQFKRPPGMPVCSPPDEARAAPAESPDPNGPVCFARPEDQGLIIPATPDGFGLGPPALVYRR
jgi:hypothetical protein